MGEILNLIESVSEGFPSYSNTGEDKVALDTGLRGPVVKSADSEHWISHRCGSSLARGTCEMSSSAPVGQVVFLRVLRLSPTFD